MVTKINIEIDETGLKRLILEYLCEKLNDTNIQSKDIEILTKSVQNFKAEWEKAAFKATYCKTI